jgi:hypothetical protein
MSQEKYIGMDVHQATISVAIMDSKGKPIMEWAGQTRRNLPPKIQKTCRAQHSLCLFHLSGHRIRWRSPRMHDRFFLMWLTSTLILVPAAWARNLCWFRSVFPFAYQ